MQDEIDRALLAKQTRHGRALAQMQLTGLELVFVVSSKNIEHFVVVAAKRLTPVDIS